MSVEYCYAEDSFCRAEVELRRAIGQYACRNRYIYIGLTQQKPSDRFRQHQKKWAVGHKWDKMVVIYRARSFTLMQTVEDRLIQYTQRKIAKGDYCCILINDIDSQCPMVSKNLDDYWIYILVQK